MPGPHHHHIELFRKRHPLHFTCEYRHHRRAGILPLAPEQFDEFETQPYRLNQEINLPPGPISLHVGILDSVSSKVGTLEIPVNVREPAR
jgi:hypothetical protein